MSEDALSGIEERWTRLAGRYPDNVTPLMKYVIAGSEPFGLMAILNDRTHLRTINAQDDSGMTALLYACKDANGGFVEILLEKGANPVLKNNEGKGVLELWEEGARVNEVWEDHDDPNDAYTLLRQAINAYTKPARDLAIAERSLLRAPKDDDGSAMSRARRTDILSKSVGPFITGEKGATMESLRRKITGRARRRRTRKRKTRKHRRVH